MHFFILLFCSLLLTIRCVSFVQALSWPLSTNIICQQIKCQALHYHSSVRWWLFVFTSKLWVGWIDCASRIYFFTFWCIYDLSCLCHFDRCCFDSSIHPMSKYLCLLSPQIAFSCVRCARCIGAGAFGCKWWFFWWRGWFFASVCRCLPTVTLCRVKVHHTLCFLECAVDMEETCQLVFGVNFGYTTNRICYPLPVD